MPWSYAPEQVEEVRVHVEESTLTYPEIAKLTGRSASTISRWKCRHGWKRPPGAVERRPIEKDRCAAAKRAMDDGARYQEVAVLLDRSTDVVRRLRRPSPGAGRAAGLIEDLEGLSAADVTRLFDLSCVAAPAPANGAGRAAAVALPVAKV